MGWILGTPPPLFPMLSAGSSGYPPCANSCDGYWFPSRCAATDRGTYNEVRRTCARAFAAIIISWTRRAIRAIRWVCAGVGAGDRFSPQRGVSASFLPAGLVTVSIPPRWAVNHHEAPTCRAREFRPWISSIGLRSLPVVRAGQDSKPTARIPAREKHPFFPTKRNRPLPMLGSKRRRGFGPEERKGRL